MAVIALTPGCPAGVGPELFPLALSRANLAADTSFVWCGSAALFEIWARHWGMNTYREQQSLILKGAKQELRINCTLDDNVDLALSIKPGKPDEHALVSQKEALLSAIRLAQANQIDAIVTGPVRKAALIDIEGHSFSGQTELLHHYLAADQNPPLMCFAGYSFILGLATIHVPLERVSGIINQALLSTLIERLLNAAAVIFNLPHSQIRMAVLGLNPHAGEDGLIGDEEIKTIKPAIALLRKSGIHLDGPLPADGFFGNLYRAKQKHLPHAVLAMYHDQGLAPYKLLCHGKVANITFGLTLPRTSPAHGTADDIAGKLIASPDSLIEAIEQAEKLV